MSFYTPLSDIELIHTELRKGFRTGKSKSIEFRKQQLFQLYKLLSENYDKFNVALASDLGRSPAENTILEFNGSLAEAKTAHDNVEKWAKSEAAPWSFNYWMSKPTIRKEPKGVVLIIVPFNYPLWLSYGGLAGAIAAGNAAVLKPSEITPATSALFAELFPQYLDPSLYRVVNGSIPETTEALRLQWDHICYTGSGRVAKVVAAAAAKYLTPTTLELGGKSPVFLDPACDLKIAARRILWGKTANAGQTCVAPDYLFVLDHHLDAVLKEFKAAYAEFYPNGPAQSDSYSKIVTDNHFQRIKGLLDNTRGTIVLGGETDPSRRFIAPTLVKDITAEDALMSEEIFGPVLPIITVKSVDEAIQFANERDHPLALYVFSQSDAFKKKVFDNTQSGSAIANDLLIQCVVDGLPFGGIGPSGAGMSTGKYSFDMFTHFRATLDNPRWVELFMKIRYPPYNESKFRMMKSTTPKLKSGKGGWSKVFVLTTAIAMLSAYLNTKYNFVNLDVPKLLKGAR